MLKIRLAFVVLQNQHIWCRIAHGMRSSGNPQSRHDELICVSHTQHIANDSTFLLFFLLKRIKDIVFSWDYIVFGNENDKYQYYRCVLETIAKKPGGKKCDV